MEEGDSTSEMKGDSDDYMSPGPSTSSQHTSINPFSKLEEGVTQEQWINWKRMNQQSGGLVETESDVASGNINDISANLDLLASLSMAENDSLYSIPHTTTIVDVNIPNTTATSHVEVIVPVTSDFQHSSVPAIGSLHQLSENLKLPPNELVMDYLTGKISFTVFKEMLDVVEMVEKDQVEDNVADQVDEDDKSEDIAVSDDPKYQPPSEDTGQATDTSSGESPRKKRKYVKKSRSRREVPKVFAGLMGEANIKFARGENEEAIKMCMEIIKEAPRAILPYQTLAMIYETMGDMQKALEFTSLAAYLNPRDEDSWVRLAEMSLELNNHAQAIFAYTQAIKVEPHNPHYHLERAKLNEELGEVKKAMEGYRSVLNLLPHDEGAQYMDLARSLSESYFKMNDRDIAIKIMRTAFSTHSEEVTSEDVNLLLELQMSEKMFLYSIEVLVSHCGVVLKLNNSQIWNKDNQEEIGEKLPEPSSGLCICKCVIPDLLPIDLRVKLAVCLIHFKQISVIPHVVGLLFDESAEEMGDLFLDVAEAYMEKDYFKEALLILDQLVHSRKYNLAAVWLKLAECLSKVGRLEDSVQAYNKVVEMAPAHVGARMSLASLQQQLGKTEEALKALSQDDLGEAVLSKQEQTLLLQKCHLLHSQTRHDEFIKAARQLLFYQFKDITKPAFLNLALSYKTPKHKFEDLQCFLKEGCQGMGKSDIPVDDLWDLYVKLCDTVLSMDRLDELLEITGLGMSCPFFMSDPRKLKQAEFMCLVACLMTKKGPLAFTFIREMCLKEGEKNQVWNLLSQVLLFSIENKYNRFCMRYLLSHPDHIPVCLLNGHNAALSGTYVYALGEYVSVLRAWPKEPLISLCIGTTFIHMAGQKFSAKKHFLLTQGLSFLNNYSELRGDCQESNYNIARALHQLGLTYAAVHYYRKVLDMKPAIEDDKGIFDLTREAAYNLMLIYNNSGSTDYVHLLMNKYLVI